MKRRNPYTLTGGENMQRKNSGKAMRYLVAVCALISALAMVGCGGGGGDEGGTPVTSGETISTVNTGSVPVSNSNVGKHDRRHRSDVGNCTVVSADSDLAAVPGLTVENWTA